MPIPSPKEYEQLVSQTAETKDNSHTSVPPYMERWSKRKQAWVTCAAFAIAAAGFGSANYFLGRSERHNQPRIPTPHQILPAKQSHIEDHSQQ